MIVLTNQILLYGKKVITDLATRVGPSTVDSYSYGLGMQYQVRAMWTEPDTEVNIEMLFNEQADFNADTKQPHLPEGEYDADVEAEEYSVGPKFNPAQDSTDFDGYYRRLEDIAPEYLEAYIGNLVYTICRRNGGLRAYRAKHMEQPVLISQGDTEDYTELADLQLLKDERDWPLESKQTALQRLPYVLKRLHNLSRYVGIHMLSYIVSYLKARDRNENLRSIGSQKVLKKNSVIDEGVYLCDKAGDIKKKVLVQNKNKRAEEAFDWITGVSSNYQAYYQDYLDLVAYIDILNIDINEDDFTSYQSSFMDKLIVTIVTPNVQYDKQIYNAILNNDSNPVVQEEDEDPILCTISTFSQIRALDENLQFYDSKRNYFTEQFILEKAKALHYVYNLMYLDKSVDKNAYRWNNGYLFHNNELVIISANCLSEPDTSVFLDDRCLIHESGYCVQISTQLNLFAMQIFDAYENLQNKIRPKDEDFKYNRWIRMGI